MSSTQSPITRLFTQSSPMAGFARACAMLAMAAMIAIVQGCASLPPHVPHPPSTAIPASATTELGRIAAHSVPSYVESAFRPLPLSLYSMNARLALVEHAQASLDLQYYLLQNDITGHALLRAVRDAAARGVRVRLLVDDLYTTDSDRMLVALAAYPNIEVRLFNPFPAGRLFAVTRWTFALTDFARVNHRMHNKMLIADGAFAVAGGRNIADEYFFTSKGGNFVDFDMLIAGDAVPRMGAIFDDYWNSRRVYPLAALETSRETPQALRESFELLSADAIGAYPPPAADAPDILGYFPLSADLLHAPLKLLNGRIDVFADDPEKVSGRSENGLDGTTVTARVGRAIASAQSDLVIGSPYFIPGEIGMAGFKLAIEKGVHIEVITNSLASNDEPFASAAYGRYRVPMLRMGVELYEVDTRQLRNDPLIGSRLGATIGRSHSKLIVIDHQTTFVGSMNMDLRSSRVNTELGMLIESTELATEVLALANRVRSFGAYRLRMSASDSHIEWVAKVGGKEIVYDDDPEVDLSIRVQLLLLFPFISESLL